MLIAGADEAGRGPVLGSLVIGCVICDENTLATLESHGVNDSKQLTPKRREQLADFIKKNVISYRILEISATELNYFHAKGLTLNEIEERHFAQILNESEPKPDEIYLDAADVKEERFGQTIGKQLTFSPKKIISKHKGDSIFKVVGAASILAKTRRDQIIDEFKTQYGNIGSGYPSDPTTQKFLRAYYKEHHNFPPIVRTWWSTAEKIAQEFGGTISKQKKMTDY
jgi:ribonuclease HII